MNSNIWGDITKLRILISISIFIVAIISYGPAVNGTYNFDDYIVTNGHRLTSQGVSSIPTIYSSPYYSDNQGYSFGYRPTTLTSFAIEESLFGQAPRVSHVVNILLFALTCVTVFLGFLNFFPKNLVQATIVSLLFATNPVHTEVVACIKNRDEILSMLFGLMGLISLSTKRINLPSVAILSIVFFSLSLTSKLSGLIFLLCSPFAIQFNRNVNIGFRIAYYLSLSGLFAFIMFMRTQAVQTPHIVLFSSSLLIIDALAHNRTWQSFFWFLNKLNFGFNLLFSTLNREYNSFKDSPLNFLRNLVGNFKRFYSEAFPQGRFMSVLMTTLIGAMLLIRSHWVILLFAVFLLTIKMLLPKKLKSIVNNYQLIPMLLASLIDIDLPIHLVIASIVVHTRMINADEGRSISGSIIFILTGIFASLLHSTIYFESAESGLHHLHEVGFFFCLASFTAIEYFLPGRILNRVGLFAKLSFPVILLSYVSTAIIEFQDTFNLYGTNILVLINVMNYYSLRTESNAFRLSLKRQLNSGILTTSILTISVLLYGLETVATDFEDQWSEDVNCSFRCATVNYLKEDALSFINGIHCLKVGLSNVGRFIIGSPEYSIRQDVVTDLNYIKHANELIDRYSSFNSRPIQAIEYPTPPGLSYSISSGTAINTLIRYIKLNVFPYPLAFFYGYNEIEVTEILSNRSVFNILLLLTVFMLTIYLIKKGKTSHALGVFILIVGLLPFIGILEFAPGGFAERFTFSPSLGFSILLAGIISDSTNVSNRLARKPRPMIVIILLIIIPSMAYCRIRTSEWQTDLRLMTTDIEVVKNSAQAHRMLGNTILRDIRETRNSSVPQELNSKFNKAIFHLEKSMDIYPYFFNTYIDLGNAYLNFGNFSAAEKILFEAYGMDSTFYPNIELLISTEIQLNKLDEAERLCNKLIELRPTDFESYDRLSFVLYSMGNYQGSIDALRTALNIDPKNKLIWGNLAQVYNSLGDSINANICAEKAESLSSSSAHH